jgi:hypothetical protein
VTINSGDAGSTSLASGGCRFNSLSKILVVEKTMNRTLLSVLLLMLCFASLALTASNGKVHAQALPTPLRGYTTYIPYPGGHGAAMAAMAAFAHHSIHHQRR